MPHPERPSQATTAHASPDAVIADLVARYLSDLDAGTPTDPDRICAQHPALAIELKPRLFHAARVREARLAALALTSPSLVSSSRSTPPPVASALPRALGQYLIVRQIGAGGFGRVFEAHPPTGSARYAIKVLKPEYTNDKESVARFKAETRFAQRLAHPGIVEILAEGEADGLHYLVMPLVEGTDLHQFSRSKPIGPALAASIVESLAHACAAAHTAGIIHRDIKPSNILIDAATRLPRITDFGLAKQLGEATFLTESLQRLGTPHYMAPEQANRRLGPISPATDIYALGATLYYLLTGRPPFPLDPGASRDATLKQIEWDPPIPPSELNRELPRDLEIICLKCLAKFPIDRYASASDLAADLARFQAGRRIETTLPGPFGRAARWARRRPVLASLSAALLLSLCVGAALSVYYATRASQAEEVAGTATEEKKAAVEEKEAAVEEKQSAVKEKQVAVDRLKLEQYLVDMRRAADLVQNGDLARARPLIDAYDNDASAPLRSIEWNILRKLTTSSTDLHFGAPGDTWRGIAVDSTGRSLVAIDGSGTVVAWDIASGAEKLRTTTEKVASATFSANDDILLGLATDRSAIHLWDAKRWTPYRSLSTEWKTTAAATNPDGTRMIIGDGASHLFLFNIPSGQPSMGDYDLTSGHRRGLGDTSLDIQHGDPIRLAFTPDGASFVVGYIDGAAQTWTINGKRIIARLETPHVGPISGLVISPSGATVASQSIGDVDTGSSQFLPGDIKLWDRATGAILWTAQPHVLPPNFPKQPTRILTSDPRVIYPAGQFVPAFSSDSQHIYSTGDHGISVWNAKSGAPEPPIKLDSDTAVIGVATASKSSLIAAITADHSIIVKRQGASELISTLADSASPILSLESSADGSRLAAITAATEHVRLIGGPGGDRIQSHRTGDYAARVWDSSTGATLGSTGTFFEHPAVLAFNPCAKHFESFAAFPKNINRSGEPITDPTATINFTTALHPPGCRAAVLPPDYTSKSVRVSVAEATPVEVLPVDDSRDITAIAFSPDGSLAAIGLNSGRVALITLDPPALKAELPAVSAPVSALRFSHDSAMLARGAEDGSITLVSTANTSQIAVIASHKQTVGAFAFSPDNRRLISASGLVSKTGAAPGSISIWDTSSGALCMELPTPDRCAFTGLALAPDGSRLYAAANHVDAKPTDARQASILVWTIHAADH